MMMRFRILFTLSCVWLAGIPAVWAVSDSAETHYVSDSNWQKGYADGLKRGGEFARTHPGLSSREVSKTALRSSLDSGGKGQVASRYPSGFRAGFVEGYRDISEQEPIPVPDVASAPVMPAPWVKRSSGSVPPQDMRRLPPPPGTLSDTPPIEPPGNTAAAPRDRIHLRNRMNSPLKIQLLSRIVEIPADGEITVDAWELGSSPLQRAIAIGQVAVTAGE